MCRVVRNIIVKVASLFRKSAGLDKKGQCQQKPIIEGGICIDIILYI